LEIKRVIIIHIISIINVGYKTAVYYIVTAAFKDSKHIKKRYCLNHIDYVSLTTYCQYAAECVRMLYDV